MFNPEIVTEYPGATPSSCWNVIGAKHVLYIGGRDASRHTVVNYRVRIGAAAFRMAGIAGVGTESEFRMKGYARRVLEHSLAWMDARGYDISMLFGIPNLYTKFGFATCIRETGFTISLAHAAAVRGTLAVRPGRPADLPEIMKLHREANKLLAGVADRDAAAWGRVMAAVAANCVVAPATGRIGGYAFIGGGNWYADMLVRNNEKQLIVPEVICRDAPAADALISFLGTRARGDDKADVLCACPAVGTFAETCFERGGRRFEYITPNGGGMARIVNLRSFCRRITPELSRTLAASNLANASIALHLATDAGGLIIAAASGRLHAEPAALPPRGTIIMPQAVLVKLVFGYDHPERILARAGLRLRRAERQFICTLFPRRQPYFWALDRF